MAKTQNIINYFCTTNNSMTRFSKTSVPVMYYHKTQTSMWNAEYDQYNSDQHNINNFKHDVAYDEKICTAPKHSINTLVYI